MTWISTRIRITFGLVCLLISTLLMSIVLGIVPDRERAVLEGRRALCESVAVNGSLMMTQQDLKRLQTLLEVVVSRNRDMLSAGVRRADGKLLVDVGNHAAHWRLAPGERSSDTQVQVPIRAGQQKWGAVEIRFNPVAGVGLVNGWLGSRGLFVAFMATACFLLFAFYLRKMLEYLDPSQVVPGHVRSALDSLAEGLLVIDARDRIVLANEAIASLLGQPAEKLLGSPASRLPWVRDKADDPAEPLPWVTALEEKMPRTNVLLRLMTARSGVRTFLVNSSPVLGHQGEYRGVLASFDDVTNLQETERELRRAKESADAANRTKSEFLANMSHEIRTPMNTILGFADVLRRGLAADDDERQRYLNTIHSSGKHLLELINDILDLSKIEAGRMELERRSCAPLTLVGEVINLFRVPAETRGLSLDVTAAGRIPLTVQTDPTRLRQILTNLVGNALKFTEQGGVKIVVRMQPDAERPRLAIDVVDTGIGISAEALGKLFNPFVQADNTVTRRFGGTGLGLAISRRFAEALGGELTVSSEPGRGSTFTVTFDPGPLSDAELVDGPQAVRAALTPQAAASTAAIPKLPPARVLVADDGESNRQLISVILTRAGMHVEGVADGQAAVEAAQRTPFDIVLMDMQMPVLDGYQATTRLRQQGFRGPIVALTANAMKGDEEKCRAAGCSGFVPKPVDIDELLRCLTDQLRGVELVVYAEQSKPRADTASALPAPPPEAAKSQETAQRKAPPQAVEASAAANVSPNRDEAPGLPLAGASLAPSRPKNRWAALAVSPSGSVVSNRATASPAASASGAAPVAVALAIASPPAANAAVEELLGSLRERLNAMYDDWQRGSSEQLMQRALDLKSAAARAGQDAVGCVAGQLHDMAAQGDQTGIEVRLDELAALCERFRRPAGVTSGRSAQATPLRCSLPLEDPEFRPIIEGFLKRLRQQADQMRAACKQGNLDELARMAHWLKGAGGTVGFAAFTAPAKALEDAARSGAARSADTLLGEILDMIEHIEPHPASSACRGISLVNG